MNISFGKHARQARQPRLKLSPFPSKKKTAALSLERKETDGSRARASYRQRVGLLRIGFMLGGLLCTGGPLSAWVSRQPKPDALLDAIRPAYQKLYGSTLLNQAADSKSFPLWKRQLSERFVSADQIALIEQLHRAITAGTPETGKKPAHELFPELSRKDIEKTLAIVSDFQQAHRAAQLDNGSLNLRLAVEAYDRFLDEVLAGNPRYSAAGYAQAKREVRQYTAAISANTGNREYAIYAFLGGLLLMTTTLCASRK